MTEPEPVSILDTPTHQIAATLLYTAYVGDSPGEAAATALLCEYARGELLTRPDIREHFLLVNGDAVTVRWELLWCAINGVTPQRTPQPALEPVSSGSRSALALAAALGSGHPVHDLAAVLAGFDGENALVAIRAVYAATNHGVFAPAGWPAPPLPGLPEPDPSADIPLAVFLATERDFVLGFAPSRTAQPTREPIALPGPAPITDGEQVAA